jgi:hypothetical protein
MASSLLPHLGAHDWLVAGSRFAANGQADRVSLPPGQKLDLVDEAMHEKDTPASMRGGTGGPLAKRPRPLGPRRWLKRDGGLVANVELEVHRG